MNYRHSYHAGNFADVFKHAILTLLIQALRQKEKAFCYFDTHAGIGIYDLHDETAQKTQEFASGIARLLLQNNFPTEITDYLNCIKNLNSAWHESQKTLPQFYPGSPTIVRHLLRPQDKMILTELHEQDFQQLKQAFHRDQQVIVHHQNGYQALKAYLPPIERRGLVLIDPPYEQTDEFDRIYTALQNALRRWATGIYAIWYPIKERAPIKHFHQTLKTSGIKNILIAELSIYPEDAPLSLNGCGLAIINPPWQLDKQLASLLPWLWQALAPQQLHNEQSSFEILRDVATMEGMQRRGQEVRSRKTQTMTAHRTGTYHLEWLSHESNN